MVIAKWAVMLTLWLGILRACLADGHWGREVLLTLAMIYGTHQWRAAAAFNAALECERERRREQAGCNGPAQKRILSRTAIRQAGWVMDVEPGGSH